MTASVQYVYGVVPARFAGVDALVGAPRGIDRTVVRLIVSGNVAALVTSLDATEYSGDIVGEKLGEPEWLAPRAIAHDALVTWIGDRSAVVPFPMWTMFSDDEVVLSMLVEREQEFSDTLDRVLAAKEFCVRVSAERSALAVAAELMDSALVAIEQQASAAPPGEAYLLGRKLAAARKLAARDAAVRIADQTHQALAGASRSAVARATGASGEPGVLLDGAYLVADDKYEPFREVLTDLMAIYQPAGIRFDFTGPWPPYHFVRDK